VVIKTSGEPHSKEEAAGSVLRDKVRVTAERARIIRNVIAEAEKRIANLVLKDANQARPRI
jgi:Fe2+ or Zn2+ uptake regulation protein